MTTPYLTPEKFRTLGLGVDVDGLEEVELRSVLLAASATVDSYCNVPRLPQPYSFRGGTVTNEQRPWDIGDALREPQRRIFLRFTPVKEISSLRIYVTKNQFATFNVDDVFVLPEQGIAEITSLSYTPFGLFGGAVIPNIGLGRPQAAISYTYGYQFTATDELLDQTDARTFTADNQFWDDSDVTVTRDGTEVDPGEYEIDREEGAIVFDDAQGTVTVRATYGYSLPYDIAQATALTAAASLNERELVAKGMGGNIRRLSVGEITIERGDRYRSMAVQEMHLTPTAEVLASPFRFITVR